ncbi:MAG: hypothetical protein ACYDGZ_28100, partial [Desulfosporosinus fructosivorans]
VNVLDVKNNISNEYTSYDVHRNFFDMHNNGLKKILLCGPAVSGKTTALYRIAYELTKENILSLIFKQQANYKKGVLKDIYLQIQSGFTVLIDNLTVNNGEVYKMILKYLKQYGKYSDIDKKRELKLEETARKNIGMEKYKELVNR